jgi:cobalt/nickel transport system permease protein
VLCARPAKEILSIWKTAFVGAGFACLLLLPAAILNPGAISNYGKIVCKVFLCLELVTLFNHTTQWNHITGALRKLKVPGVFIFTLDITLKYIVLLGTFIDELLISLSLRSVGKNRKKYEAVGGVMGVAFLRGTEMSQEMYHAMCCRGFTDDYNGL